MQGKRLVLIIGGNLDDRMALLVKCRNMLVGFFGPVGIASAVYESEAWGGKSSGNYLNQVLVFGTHLDPESILDTIQSVEKQLGRNRLEKWGNRTMDIDILFWGDERVDSPSLTVPHPFLHLRRFVLVPLAEILPDWPHPAFQQTVADLLDRCPDTSMVWLYEQKNPDLPGFDS